jgi:hypothetical protein
VGRLNSPARKRKESAANSFDPDSSMDTPMRKHPLTMPILAGLIALAGVLPEAMAAAPGDTQVPALSPGQARVWFLRPGSPAAEVYGAAPAVCADGARIADIPVSTAFYHDFTPGLHRFTVQPYGLTTGAADTVQLAPGTQTYLEIQWDPAWQEGYPDQGYLSRSFFVLNLSPQLAQAYLPTLTDLGRR